MVLRVLMESGRSATQIMHPTPQILHPCEGVLCPNFDWALGLYCCFPAAAFLLLLLLLLLLLVLLYLHRHCHKGQHVVLRPAPCWPGSYH
jgi:hypothetical protein